MLVLVARAAPFEKLRRVNFSSVFSASENFFMSYVLLASVLNFDESFIWLAEVECLLMFLFIFE